MLFFQCVRLFYLYNYLYVTKTPSRQAGKIAPDKQKVRTFYLQVIQQFPIVSHYYDCYPFYQFKYTVTNFVHQKNSCCTLCIQMRVQKKKTRMLSYVSKFSRRETWARSPKISCFLNSKVRFWSVCVFFIKKKIGGQK